MTPGVTDDALHPGCLAAGRTASWLFLALFGVGLVAIPATMWWESGFDASKGRVAGWPLAVGIEMFLLVGFLVMRAVATPRRAGHDRGPE